MVTVQIDETTLLTMLMDRLENFTSDSDVQALFEEYYQGMIDSGCFEGVELDIMEIVDNDYINNFNVWDSKELERNEIEKDDDRIVVRDDENDLYLVQAF